MPLLLLLFCFFFLFLLLSYYRIHTLNHFVIIEREYSHRINRKAVLPLCIYGKCSNMNLYPCYLSYQINPVSFGIVSESAGT